MLERDDYRGIAEHNAQFILDTLVTGRRSILHPAGTAPGLVVPGHPAIVVMPGPPRELHSMWPQLADLSISYSRTKTWYDALTAQVNTPAKTGKFPLDRVH